MSISLGVPSAQDSSQTTQRTHYRIYRRSIPLWNHSRTKVRYITPLKADELELKREAFNTSYWIHGKGRTQRELQMHAPERAPRTSPAAISKRECEVNAGVYEAHERKRFEAVRAKVNEWEKMTKEFRAAITLRVKQMPAAESLNAYHAGFDYKLTES